MLYNIAHPLVRFIAWLFFRLKVIGEANVPRTGGVIVAANHNSFLDIPLLGCALSRRADNIAKDQLFKNRWVATLFRALGGFPVRREGMDRSALEEAGRRLREGHLLVLYPEGKRSSNGKLRSPKPGIGMLVARTGVPVVPVYIDGTDRAWPPGQRWIRPGKITITFGKPVDFCNRSIAGSHEAKEQKDKNNIEERKETYLQVAQDVMEQIAALRPW